MRPRLLTVGVVLLGCSVQAFAICPDPTPGPCYLLHRSKATFIGAVIREHEHPGDKGHDDGIVYTLRVVRQFKGAPARTIKVFTERNSGGEYLDVGKTYIVFAMEGDRKHPLVIGCRLTQEIQDVDAAARMLENVSKQKGDAIVRGKVEDRGKPVPGATVRVRGPRRTLNLSSGKDGSFQAKVPPGKYSVSVRGPDGRRMRQTDYNSVAIDSEGFVTESGECVDLVFEYE
ncbi:MAG: carboxypeptidase regulatory-like domain-containing protein [Terriglobales bacterium]